MKKTLFIVALISAGCSSNPRVYTLREWDKSIVTNTPPFYTEMERWNDRVEFVHHRGEESQPLTFVQVSTNWTKCSLSLYTPDWGDLGFHTIVSGTNIWTRCEFYKHPRGKVAIIAEDGDGLPDIRYTETKDLKIIEKIQIHFATNKVEKKGTEPEAGHVRK